MPLLLALLIANAWAQPPEDAGVLVDRVLVVVEDTPIAASRVAFLAAVKERCGDADVFGRVLTERVEPLESLIFQEVLRAGPARAVRLTDKQAGLERLHAFEGTFDSPADAGAFRARWGVDRAAMLELFQESARLDAAIELSVQFQVSDDEERTYYERHRDDVFGGRPYGEVADQVSRRAYSLRFEAEFNSWRARLRSAASLRYVAR